MPGPATRRHGAGKMAVFGAARIVAQQWSVSACPICRLEIGGKSLRTGQQTEPARWPENAQRPGRGGRPQPKREIKAVSAKFPHFSRSLDTIAEHFVTHKILKSRLFRMPSPASDACEIQRRKSRQLEFVFGNFHMFKSHALILVGCASLLFATGCVNTALIADDAATSANKPFFFNNSSGSSATSSTGTVLARKSDAESGGGKAKLNSRPLMPGLIDNSGGNIASSAPRLASNSMPTSAMPGMMMPNQAMPNQAIPGMMMPPMMPGVMMPPMMASMPPMMPPMMPGPMMSAATLGAPQGMAQGMPQGMMGSPFVPAAYGIGPNSPLAYQAASAQQPNFNRPAAGMPNAASYSNTPSLNYPTGPAVGANGLMPLGSYSQFARPSGPVYQITDVSNEPDLASAGSNTQTVTAGKESREKARATGDVFMRSGPGKTYATKGVVKRGEVADVEFCEGKWCKITVNGNTGYSSARFLSFFKE